MKININAQSTDAKHTDKVIKKVDEIQNNHKDAEITLNMHWGENPHWNGQYQENSK